MSDVIWAAIVAGVVGVLGSMVGSVTTMRIARETAKQEQQRREEDRFEAAQGERVLDYKQFAWLLERLSKYAATGYPPSAEDWMDWLDHYYYWSRHSRQRCLVRRRCVGRNDRTARS